VLKSGRKNGETLQIEIFQFYIQKFSYNSRYNEKMQPSFVLEPTRIWVSRFKDLYSNEFEHNMLALDGKAWQTKEGKAEYKWI
jgi:hypothetical protein